MYSNRNSFKQCFPIKAVFSTNTPKKQFFKNKIFVRCFKFFLELKIGKHIFIFFTYSDQFKEKWVALLNGQITGFFGPGPFMEPKVHP